MAGTGRFKWTVLPAAAGAAQDAASRTAGSAQTDFAALPWLSAPRRFGLRLGRRQVSALPGDGGRPRAARGFASRAKLRPGASAVATCRWPERRTTFAFGHGVTV